MASQDLALLTWPHPQRPPHHPCDPEAVSGGSSLNSPGPGRRLTSCLPRRRGSPRWPAGACAGVASYTRLGQAPGLRRSGSAAPAPGRWGLSAEGRRGSGDPRNPSRRSGQSNGKSSAGASPEGCCYGRRWNPRMD